MTSEPLVTTSVNEWCRGLADLRTVYGRPIESVDDPRADVLAQSGAYALTPARIAEYITCGLSEELGHAYFDSAFSETFNPPLPTPGWASSVRMYLVDWPDARIRYQSAPIGAVPLRVWWEQTVVIVTSDSDPSSHGPVGTVVSDSEPNLVIEVDGKVIDIDLHLLSLRPLTEALLDARRIMES
ncbi:hypothetical protein AB0N73_04095 [Microbacterium sp. NPDC089189]|uniref:hypothetical protein n=1 Tax=Microbacterium sp. NPDC089189 TaxID=3154972 RepID=UPI00343D0C95